MLHHSSTNSEPDKRRRRSRRKSRKCTAQDPSEIDNQPPKPGENGSRSPLGRYSRSPMSHPPKSTPKPHDVIIQISLAENESPTKPNNEEKAESTQNLKNDESPTKIRNKDNQSGRVSTEEDDSQTKSVNEETKKSPQPVESRMRALPGVKSRSSGVLKTRHRSMSDLTTFISPSKNEDFYSLPRSSSSVIHHEDLGGLSRGEKFDASKGRKLKRMDTKNRTINLLQMQHLMGSFESQASGALVIHFMDHSAVFPEIDKESKLTNFLSQVYPKYNPESYHVKDKFGNEISCQSLLSEVPQVLFCFKPRAEKELSNILFLSNSCLMSRCDVFNGRKFHEWIEISSFLGGEGKHMSLRFEKLLKKKKKGKNW
eukprot:TRINITY_DN11370_c0_g1_i1.p1 TRINITY_DN11370_c0_g1~~TRINITY_DN11370_c0_g1_i1.p1  ORF type:complete len:370 (+),score=58.53 TRINITY_DN11370_c0_g1_i1:67-1176(+)